MKKTFYLLVSLVLLISCSENETAVLSSKIALKEITIENNQIKLEWNRPYIRNFSYYAIYRTNQPLTSVYDYYYSSIAQIYDIEETVYFDDLTLENNVYYTIVAFSSDNEPLISNSQKFERKNLIVFEESPNDVVFSSQNNLLFVFIENKIYKCDYDSMEIKDTIVLASSLNYGSVGIYNNETELYVSCSNGYVRIYDTNDFTEKGFVFIGGSVKSAILDKYDILYIKTYLNYDGKVYSCQRSTLNLIDEYTSWYSYDCKIKHFKNSNRIVEIPSSSRIVYYDHDNNGSFTDSDYIYDYDYPKSNDIFELFPDEDKIITHKSGAIYNSSFNYIAQLGDNYYDYYNHFFVADYIYAASAVAKEIKLFSKTSYSLIDTYNTSFYPMYVFKDNNELIIFGSNDNSYYSNRKYSIEKLTLNK
ncbi:hypothetical protein ACFLS4_00665 [Bacteroidota bacterium]